MTASRQTALGVPPAAFPSCPQKLGLYAVVPTAERVEILVKLGVPTVQLRNKTDTGAALREQVRRAVAATHQGNTRLFINDYWQLAIDAGAYGVHLGQEDLENADLIAIQQASLRLGVSTHGTAELDRALAIRPSYVALGAVFATTTKTMPTAPQGLEKLAGYVRQAGSTPTVAIGGIDLGNVAAVLATGVGSVAVVRAITEATDVPQAVRRLLDAVARHV